MNSSQRPQQQQQQQQPIDSRQQPQQDFFEARPSARVGKDVQADGDTWQEMLAVCEAPDSKLIIRSYYQNARNGKRVWDEPPSGATHIKGASEEMRKMAQLQLQEMQVVTGSVADSGTPTSSSTSSSSAPNNASKPKKGGFFFRRKKNEKQNVKEKRKLQYKPGSKLFSNKKETNPTDDVEDPRLQEAIARSIAESQGVEYIQHGQNVLPDIPTRQEEEELAMAKALSISEAETRNAGPINTPSPVTQLQQGSAEDEMVRQAIIESRREAERKTGATSEEKREVEDLLDPATNPQIQNSQVASWPQNANGLLLDTKLPATPQQQSNLISTSDDRKPPPSNATNPIAAMNGLKSPPSYASNPATISNPNYNTSNFASKPSTRSPAAMFDPYAKDSPSPAPTSQISFAASATANSDVNESESTGKSLHKMTEDGQRKSRLSFGRRSSTNKKMQDKAGVV